MLRTVVSGLMALLPFLFLICHFGERLTGAYGDLKYCAYNISWYLYPVENQKSILAIVVATGKPIYFESALMNCSHWTFKKVNTLPNMVAIIQLDSTLFNFLLYF